MASTREIFDKLTAAFNNHDRAAINGLLADDCQAIGPGGMTARGKEEVFAFNWAWIEAFPDARANVEKVYIVDNVACEEGVFTGTHKGVLKTPAGDIPPTGKQVRGEYLGINEVRGDKLVRQYLMFDRLQLMEQLGVAPAPAATSR